ncbi:SDR family oxidoreductase [Yersinia pseudotuberculosis]|uniref:SDR family oxidoreductase n=1 Tax=Yersinia pseudotuberculosis TaxID=633 RepID=UPI00034836F2|nr:SDR family oxidoreductase [Yersinia pseudotuberculosis]QES98017.1 SDR family oxidoreductase [Yersinia pseudotuberculosis]CFU90060.1 putative epimerase%2C with NAD(P)-binding Rossmann-fold domain [Yersinia pseudotuberculosis]CNB45213.1 putative epimerase%2C with NAD(P)-binding Rossmann-fold domain [Yersinia pseudotuberculosis]CNB59627.1 putative epimerase%2C with NAD(P)-binding Rossmann-fold domain [Yersinia pseudotuberculosis]CRY59609.1 putative epimerase%2C with NAD(P)-binding Rossmann-fol
MKKVAIIGLGWLGMPLAQSLSRRGIDVVGSKTTPDGVDAARMSGINCYPLVLTPELICEPDDLAQLMAVDALVITLPASRTTAGGDHYFQAVQQVVDSALAFGVPRIIFTSSTSVYGETRGRIKESSPLQPVTVAGKTLMALEQWLHQLPHTSVDILRLAGLVGTDRHPGRFLAGKTGVKGGSQGVNLVHQEDVIAAIELLLNRPKGGHIYNLCAPIHPRKRDFYPACARALQLTPPEFAVEEQEGANREIDGSKICSELGFEYLYPDPSRMPLN